MIGLTCIRAIESSVGVGAVTNKPHAWRNQRGVCRRVRERLRGRDSHRSPMGRCLEALGRFIPQAEPSEPPVSDVSRSSSHAPKASSIDPPLITTRNFQAIGRWVCGTDCWSRCIRTVSIPFLQYRYNVLVRGIADGKDTEEPLRRAPFMNRLKGVGSCFKRR